MSLDKSFEIQSGDQDKWNFALQGNYFCSHLQSKYTKIQHANVQRWVLSVARNYAVEWFHRFFKTLFECFDSKVPLDESFHV